MAKVQIRQREFSRRSGIRRPDTETACPLILFRTSLGTLCRDGMRASFVFRIEPMTQLSLIQKYGDSDSCLVHIPRGTMIMSVAC